jgi:hypothetical protein
MPACWLYFSSVNGREAGPSDGLAAASLSAPASPLKQSPLFEDCKDADAGTGFLDAGTGSFRAACSVRRAISRVCLLHRHFKDQLHHAARLDELPVRERCCEGGLIHMCAHRRLVFTSQTVDVEIEYRSASLVGVSDESRTACTCSGVSLALLPRLSCARPF